MRNLAIRGAMMGASGGGVPTARDYVQDGLIAMWDGIENAGWGVHDPNATVWKDLIGNVDFDQTSNVQFDNGYKFTTTTSYLKTTKTISLPKIYSFEYVNNLPIDYSDYQSGNHGFWIFGNQWTAGPGLRCASGVCYYTGYVGQGAAKNTGSIYPADRKWYTYAMTLVCGGTLATTFKFGSGEYKQELNSGPSFGAKTSALVLGYTGVIENWGYAPIDSKVHCVRIYNRVLTDAEVAANYAIDKARFRLT